ncbi:MAG: alpha/beta hydrolase-fold protein [Thomasclavelia sp.]|jgi:esterase/lipase superfamily enzyme|nr:alpha/beta hydrolase-fold protein [Thomasclavelia sp.]
MNIRYYKEYSNVLNRDMEFKIYGDKGIPILAFPAQDGRFYDLENFGLINSIEQYINDNKVVVITCDTIDKESYSDLNGDKAHRSFMLEQYYHYICDELVPLIHKITKNRKLLYTTGVSLGGSHAANMFFRRPDLFKGCISLSGYFDSDIFFGDYHDDNVFNNSPIQYLSLMDSAHKYIKMYNKRNIIICCGRGDWEDEMQRSSGTLQEILTRLGVNCWIDYWGYDVNHDWNWWKKQLPYYVGHILEGEK